MSDSDPIQRDERAPIELEVAEFALQVHRASGTLATFEHADGTRTEGVVLTVRGRLNGTDDHVCTQLLFRRETASDLFRELYHQLQ